MTQNKIEDAANNRLSEKEIASMRSGKLTALCGRLGEITEQNFVQHEKGHLEMMLLGYTFHVQILDHDIEELKEMPAEQARELINNEHYLISVCLDDQSNECTGLAEFNNEAISVLLFMKQAASKMEDEAKQNN